jgi:hypothetical protein
MGPTSTNWSREDELILAVFSVRLDGRDRCVVRYRHDWFRLIHRDVADLLKLAAGNADRAQRCSPRNIALKLSSCAGTTTTTSSGEPEMVVAAVWPAIGWAPEGARGAATGFGSSKLTKLRSRRRGPARMPAFFVSAQGALSSPTQPWNIRGFFLLAPTPRGCARGRRLTVPISTRPRH